jgi:hypothetical protein
MKIDPVNESALIINSTAVGMVTRKMVRGRAAESALIYGRDAKSCLKTETRSQESRTV